MDKQIDSWAYKNETCATCKHCFVYSEEDGGGANCMLYLDYADPNDKACPAWNEGEIGKMSDYIKREDVLAFPLRAQCDKEHVNPHFMNGIETVMEYVEDKELLPPQNVAPVKHGKWLKTTNIRFFKCSCCNEEMDSYLYDYCPWCGAKMDGDNNARD